jgi:hypothetical protein
MPTYKVFNGQEIECDYIFYIDPTSGDDSNDGLKPQTAFKSTRALKASSFANKTNKIAVFVFVKGKHNINCNTYYEDIAFGALCVPYKFQHCYFVANPRNTLFNLTVDYTSAIATASGNFAPVLFDDSWYSTGNYSSADLGVSSPDCYLIGIRAKITRTGSAAYYPVVISDTTKTTGVEYINCYMECLDNYGFWLYTGASAKIVNSVFKGQRFTGTFNRSMSAINSAFISAAAGSGDANVITTKCASNRSESILSAETVLSGLTVDGDCHLFNDGDSVDDNYGVWQGAYAWGYYQFRSNFYLRDSVGDYYRVSDGALEAVAELVEEEGLERNLSSADMELIRTLDAPVLVGFGAETIAYKAIGLDDIQLLTPTGDIDLSLASAINSFVFGDAGDVRRLLSVDRGVTWQYWDSDNAVFAEFTGDITDKAAVYAAANDTATLNALTAAQIAEIIPASAVDKHIRFLTVLRQEMLSDDTRTLSVCIDNERRGYFKSVPAALFEETLFTGSLQIKYTGAGGITELHLLLSV